MNETWWRRCLFVGISVGALLIIHGLLTVGGGGSSWNSDEQRIFFGILQSLAGAAILTGLTLSSRHSRIGLTLVAAGATAICVLFYWLAVFTVPIGIVLLAAAYSNARRTTSPKSDERGA